MNGFKEVDKNMGAGEEALRLSTRSIAQKNNLSLFPRMGILEAEEKQKVVEKEGLLVPTKISKAERQACCRVSLTG